MRKSPYIFFYFQRHVATKAWNKIVGGTVGYVHMLSFFTTTGLCANCMCTCHVSIYLENYVVHIYIGDRIVVFIC